MTDAVFGTIRQRWVLPYGLLVAVLAIAVVVLFGMSLYLGYANLDLVQAFRDLLSGDQSLAALVLTELRFPRALLGCIVGFSLGLSGAATRVNFGG